MLYSALEGSQIGIIILLVAVVALMIVFPMITNKKRSKAIADQHSALKVGDKIMTIGGIIGTILEIRQTSPVDKEIVIETGVEGRTTTMVMDVKALYQVIPPVGTNYAPQQNVATQDVFDDTTVTPAETVETIDVVETIETENSNNTEIVEEVEEN